VLRCCDSETEIFPSSSHPPTRLSHSSLYSLHSLHAVRPSLGCILRLSACVFEGNGKGCLVRCCPFLRLRLEYTSHRRHHSARSGDKLDPPSTFSSLLSERTSKSVTACRYSPALKTIPNLARLACTIIETQSFNILICHPRVNLSRRSVNIADRPVLSGLFKILWLSEKQDPWRANLHESHLFLTRMPRVTAILTGCAVRSFSPLYISIESDFTVLSFRLHRARSLTPIHGRKLFTLQTLAPTGKVGCVAGSCRSEGYIAHRRSHRKLDPES